MLDPGVERDHESDRYPFMFQQKTTRWAVAAMSRLAELYNTNQASTSAEIAKVRGLPQPNIAKVLSTLARFGYISGSTGPGGGYRLAKPPGEITLWEIVRLFEKEREVDCPFGPSWCGNREPCPIHEKVLELADARTTYLLTTSFEIFSPNPPPVQKKKKTQGKPGKPRKKSTRRSRGNQ